MDQASLESALAGLHLPAIRFYHSLDSTNSEAWRWVDAGAPHGALVVAEAQTAGRGRLQRRWTTVPGGGLAFSLVLTAPAMEPQLFSRLAGLGALATCLALQKKYALAANIKWPNDILLQHRKTGGVLAESRWIGETLSAAVVGIGINIAPVSIDPAVLPPASLNFPVTCVEQVLGQPVRRMELLHSILQEFFSWYRRLATDDFLAAWEHNLAYRGKWVELSPADQALPAAQGEGAPTRLVARVSGLAQDGSLRLTTESGDSFTIQAGEIHLRPVHWRSQA